MTESQRVRSKLWKFLNNGAVLQDEPEFEELKIDPEHVANCFVEGKVSFQQATRCLEKFSG